MLTITITRAVRYKGGMIVSAGQTFSTAERDSSGRGWNVQHPRFNDPHIRLHVPAGHAREEAGPETCPACHGTGGGVYNDCGYCGGNGVI